LPLPYALPDRGTAERSCTPLARAVCSPSTLALHAATLLPGGSTPGPQARPNTCAPLAPLSPWLQTFQVRTGDSRVSMRRCLAVSVRAHRERSNGSILEFASLRHGFRVSSQAFRTRCARPFSRPPPFTLTAAQPSPPAPSYVCRVQPKHRASHAAPTQPRRSEFPAPSTRIPIGRPVALTWPVHTFQVRAGDSRAECEKTFFGAISTCASQRRFNGAMHEFGCCRVSSRAAVCCGV
jgi:hypothetical protein